MERTFYPTKDKSCILFLAVERANLSEFFLKTCANFLLTWITVHNSKSLILEDPQTLVTPDV